MISGIVIPFGGTGKKNEPPTSRGGCTCRTGALGSCPLCKAWSDAAYHQARAAEAMKRIRALGGP